MLDLTPAEMQDYQEQYKTWNPAEFNADEWMKFFKENGMRMVCITTNHHEGFSMYDTRRRGEKLRELGVAGRTQV